MLEVLKWDEVYICVYIWKAELGKAELAAQRLMPEK